MILSLPPTQLWSLLHRVGFGEMTGIGFPGEQSGSLLQRTNWSPFTLTTLAFGYGISVTTLQLAQAYSIFANDGIKLPVSLVKIKNIPQGERVMDAKVADEMLRLLEAVTTEKGATGGLAQVPGYHVAGKTGTASIPVNGHYDPTKTIASFIGFAPADNPKFIMLVILNKPTASIYGAETAAPIWFDIAKDMLAYYGIAPSGGD